MTTRARNRIGAAILFAAVGAAILVFSINRNSAAPAPANIATSAPGVTFDTASGTLTLASLQDKPTAVAFVQAGCESCAASLKAFSNLAARMPSAHFVALNMPGGGSASTLSDFGSSLGATGITYAAYTSNDISKNFNVTSLDTILVLDAQGQIAWRAVRPSQADIQQALVAAGA